MAEDNLIQPGSNRNPQNEDMIHLRKFLNIVRDHWYYFLISITVALSGAYIYTSYSLPTYRVSAKLLIEEGKKETSTGNDKVLDGFDLMAGMRNIDNQLMILTSKSLISRTLNELPLYNEYFYYRLFKKMTLYPNPPIKIINESLNNLPRDIKFSFKYLGYNNFKLDARSDSSFELHVRSAFGKSIEFSGGRFRIERGNSDMPAKDWKHKIYFTYNSRTKLVDSYRKRLVIEPASKKGSIVVINLDGTNKKMDLDFLNKYVENFLNISLEKKNTEAIRTVQFIDDQLIGVSDSLIITENKLQKFRSKNMVMDLSTQGQVIINQAMRLENEKARLGIEANYHDYLAEYLDKDVSGEVPISPATMGITDPGLTKLVADLADQQGQFYSKSLGDKNPLQNQLAQKVRNTKDALKETLNGVRRANKLAVAENQEQIRTINAQASALPMTEKELLGIERRYKLNNELYTFLLEKRAVAQIQKASNIADNEIIDPPEIETKPVRPNKAIVFLFALMTGFGLPLLVIGIREAFSIRIKREEDIKNITRFPVSGHIPHSFLKRKLIVLNEPESPVTEAFRALRSRMQFFTKEIKSPVIMITSPMPKEGKTFTAINLASSFSLMGRKTVLVGFDLRQPKIYEDFGLDNEHGISTWLIGKDTFQDIVRQTRYDNLSIITAGPVPPNPAELTAMEKTNELLKLLKLKFECIIIDSSPVGTVSDSIHLASLADTCILIVRQNMTYKDLLEETVKELKNSEIKSLSIVVNDIVSDKRRYGYGGSYMYSYKNDNGKNNLSKSKNGKLYHLIDFSQLNYKKMFLNLFENK